MSEDKNLKKVKSKRESLKNPDKEDSQVDNKDLKRKDRKYSLYQKKDPTKVNDKDVAALVKKNQAKEGDSEKDNEIKKCKSEMRKNDTIAGIFATAMQIVNFVEVEEYYREDVAGDKVRNKSSSLNFYLRSLCL